MPRNAKQDALDEPTFERLLEATDELPEPFCTECAGILIFGGRLGMRGGEIAHLDESWVNWDREMIEIPAYDRCDHGSNGGPCGYCRQQAALAAENDADLSYDKALEQRWEPKTSNSARAIPFGFDAEIEAAVAAFFERFDRYQHSRASVNRRVDRVLDRAGLPRESCYPHALRATAATWHAYRGLSAPALQSLFGWANLDVAQKYIRLSGGATAEALRETHQ